MFFRNPYYVYNNATQVRVLWHCQAPREWSLSGLLLRGATTQREPPERRRQGFVELFRLKDGTDEPQRLDVVPLESVGLRMFQIHLNRRNGPRFCAAEVFAFGPSGKVVSPELPRGTMPSS